MVAITCSDGYRYRNRVDYVADKRTRQVDTNIAAITGVMGIDIAIEFHTITTIEKNRYKYGTW